MDKALELQDVSKEYKIVRRKAGQGETRLLGLRKLTQFFLGETFSVLGTRSVASITALDRVNLSVGPGQVVGLFGKNGSGKTTLLSILGGIFPPDSGQVRCFGHDLSTQVDQIRQYVVPVFGWLDAITWAFTGRQNIEKFMIMHHVDPALIADQIDALAREIEIDERLDDRAARYSQGMRVKIQVMTAILLYRMRGRALLLFDEPFIGLDVFSQRYLRQFVKYQLRHENFATILATHQPEDIEEVCDEVIVIDQGRIIAQDSVEALRRRVKKAENIRLEYASPSGQPLADSFFAQDGVLECRSLTRDQVTEVDLLVEDSRATLSWLVGDLIRAGHQVVSLQTRAMKFEDVLVKLIEGEAI
ncbi:MAG: ATP-binding cassette domain-containing protein [Candidatus Latescibacteria bacterium]|nr:ATP-binding cassette domain-containing protein [Candidatus Latescibacterota bacterium]